MTGTPWLRAAAASFAIMALAQIAIPLVDDDRTLTVVVIVGFSLTTLHLVAHTWGPTRAWMTLGIVAAGTLVLERVGSTTGVPFGEYHYTDALTPQVGGVPAVVPLAWFAMCVPALAVGRGLAPGSRGATVAVGAVALTAWDLFLDPQMVDAGYWVWATDGFYRGIPLSNYAGWLGSSLVVLAVADRLLPAATGSRRPELLALYTWWAVMNTIGFIVFFGDAVVGVVGGIVMVPLAIGALVRTGDAQRAIARVQVARG